MSAGNTQVPGIRYKDNTMHPYCVPEPVNRYEQHLWQLAHAFGKPSNAKYAPLLYGSLPHLYYGDKNDKARMSTGVIMDVPEWVKTLVSDLLYLFEAARNEGHKHGLCDGKRLIARLAAGEITVNEFEKLGQ